MTSNFACRLLPYAACAAAAVFSVTSASAQTPPNLVGTWKGKAEAVFVGPTPYRSAESAGPNFGGPMEYTYVIKQQQGARFTGESSSTKVTETIIGALRAPAYRSGIILDQDGENDFTLRDDKTMDICYRHLNLMSRVIACFTLEKQP